MSQDTDAPIVLVPEETKLVAIRQRSLLLLSGRYKIPYLKIAVYLQETHTHLFCQKAAVILQISSTGVSSLVGKRKPRPFGNLMSYGTRPNQCRRLMRVSERNIQFWTTRSEIDTRLGIIERAIYRLIAILILRSQFMEPYILILLTDAKIFFPYKLHVWNIKLIWVSI